MKDGAKMEAMPSWPRKRCYVCLFLCFVWMVLTWTILGQ